LNEQTESSEEFMDGISPECRVMPDRMETVSDEIAAYGRKAGADQPLLTFACHRARNALDDGRSGSYAYDVGRQTIDDHLSITRNHQPITAAWCCAKDKGVLDIHCTATGVSGHLRHKGEWFRVTVEPMQGS